MKLSFEELDRLKFSPAQKEALVRRLSAKVPERPRLSRLPYRAAALVAALSMLIGAAGAVSLAGISPEFCALFGITTQAEAESLGAVSVQQTFRDRNGSQTSVTVREAVRDQERLYALLDLTLPEDAALPGVSTSVPAFCSFDCAPGNETGRFFADADCTQEIPLRTGHSVSLQLLNDLNPADRSLPLLFTVCTDQGFPDEAAYFRLDGLSGFSLSSGAQTVQVLDGLDLEFVVPLISSAAYSFQGRCGVKLGADTLAVVEDLTLSSISLSFDLIPEDPIAYDAALNAQGGTWPAYILMNDGSQVDISFSGHQTYGRIDSFFDYESPEALEGPGRLEFFRAEHISIPLPHPIDLSQISDIVFVGDNDTRESGKVMHFTFSPLNFSNYSYWYQISEKWMDIS